MLSHRIAMIEDGIPAHRSHFITANKYLKRYEPLHKKDKQDNLKIQNALQILKDLLFPS